MDQENLQEIPEMTRNEYQERPLEKFIIFTQITQEEKKPELSILAWYADFEDVFSKKIHEILPSY